MEPVSLRPPWRPVGGMVGGTEAPSDKVAGVESDAEEIRGNEAELRRAYADDADDSAVNGSHDPALPEFPTEENGAENRENARDVIQTQQLVK